MYCARQTRSLRCCHAGDFLSPGASITRCCIAWGNFNELLLVLTSYPFPTTTRGGVYNSLSRAPCAKQVETWPQPHLICIAFKSSYDPQDMWYHHQGPSHFARSPGVDRARRSGKDTLHPLSQMARPYKA